MKVAQNIDVDGVTIIINTDNKLEAKVSTPTTGSVEIEELTGTLNATITSNSQEYPVTKVGRVKGTNWLVFQAEGLLQTQTTPPVTEPEQPPASNQMSTHLDYKCPKLYDLGDSYEMTPDTLNISIVVSGYGDKVPQTVKVTAHLGSQSREYSFPYSPTNSYAWSGINDFNWEGSAGLSFSSAYVKFTDGTRSVASSNLIPSCMMSGLPE